MRIALVLYLAVVAIMSLVAIVAYGFDKRRAQTGGWRVPEKNLQLIALAGGWPGALAAQQLFRHKTQKLSFRLVFWLMIALHLTAVGGVAYWAVSHSG